MQFEQDSRNRVLRRLAIGAGVLALPLVGYGFGMLHGTSSQPTPEPREIVLSEPGGAKDAGQAAGQDASRGLAATQQPETLPSAPLGNTFYFSWQFLTIRYHF